MADRGGHKTKRGYSANGLQRSAAERLVRDEERKFAGTTAHPWPKKLKARMVDAIDGALSGHEIEERIKTLRLEHEQAVFLAHRKARALRQAVATQRLPAGPKVAGGVFDRLFGGKSR